jgi:hypothetical protein
MYGISPYFCIVNLSQLNINIMKAKHTLGILFILFLVFGPGHKVQAQQIEVQQTDEEQQRELQEEELRERKELLEAQEDEMRAQEREYTEQVRHMRASSRYVEVVPAVHYQDSHSQLTLRNSFKGGTDSSKGEFEVDSGTTHFRCMINGKVRSGEITIKVLYPGGKVFKDLTINSSAEISFSQSLSIKSDKAAKYIGSWQYEIKAEKAEGSYVLQISTN